MAKSEAQHTLRLLNGRKPLYGVWYDVEDPQIASANVVATSQAFCDAMEAAGLYAGIYASLSWLNGALNSPKLDKYDKWVAQWNSSCTYKKDYGLWQFTDKMVAAGKNFDGNWAYKDYPAIIRGMSGEGEKEPEEPSGEDTFTYEQWKAYKERYEKEISAKPISSWAETAVEWAKKNKIMNGDANGSFRPRSNITREEMAQVAMNEAEVFG